MFSRSTLYDLLCLSLGLLAVFIAYRKDLISIGGGGNDDVCPDSCYEEEGETEDGEDVSPMMKPGPVPDISIEGLEFRVNVTAEAILDDNPVKPRTREEMEKYMLPKYGFDVEVGEFDDTYRNPCWVNETDDLNCLPYFHIMGFEKSATSDLFLRLIRHPFIVPGFDKEVHWWSLLKHRGMTLSEYIDHFQYVVFEIFNMNENAITIDGSPSTVWESHTWYRALRAADNSLDMSDVPLVPHLLHYINPKTKLVVIMRDPIDRLYSDYKAIGSLEGWPHSPEEFHYFVVKNIQYFQDCFEENGIWLCLNDRFLHPERGPEMKVRLPISCYAVFLNNWVKVFPPEQILFIKTEHYKENKAQVLEGVFDFLEVPPLRERELKVIIRDKEANKAREDIGPMFNKTRKILEDFYKPFNDALEVLLERNAKNTVGIR